MIYKNMRQISGNTDHDHGVSFRSYIVLEVVHALDFRVAGFVVDVQIAEETDAAVGLHEATTRMGLESLSDDGILNCNICNGSADGKRLVSAP